MLLAVAVKLVEPSDGIERVHGQVVSRQVRIIIKSKRDLDINWHINGTNSYPWLKVHYETISTRLLNDHDIPWEWDNENPEYIVIKQWIQQNEMNMFIKHFQHITESRDLLLHAGLPTNPYGKPHKYQERIAIERKRRLCKPITSLLNFFGCIKVAKFKSRNSRKPNHGNQPLSPSAISPLLTSTQQTSSKSSKSSKSALPTEPPRSYASSQAIPITTTSQLSKRPAKTKDLESDFPDPGAVYRGRKLLSLLQKKKGEKHQGRWKCGDSGGEG